MSKKILMLATTAAMIEQFNKNNILILEGMGYEVHVIGNWLEGNPISKERLENFKKWLEEHHAKWFHMPSTRKPTDIKNNLIAYKQVVGLINDNQYEFIHCHTPIGSVIGRLAAHKTHTKVIYTAHGFHFYKGAPFKNWLLYYPVERFLSRWTDILILINREDYNRARKSFHAKHTEYIPGVGVDIDKFSNAHFNDKSALRHSMGINDDDIVLLSVGELQERKNHKLLIEAMAQILKRTDKNVRLIIAGMGKLYDEYTIQINELGLTDNVKLLGFRNDISNLCNISDIFIFPSYQEGLPVALMEAMASGLPSVAGNIRGNSDLILDGINGYLIDTDDMAAWIDRIVKLVEEPILRSRIGKEARYSIEKYSIDNIDVIMKNTFSGGNLRRLVKRVQLGIRYDEFVLVSVGELNANKNHEVIIKAISDLQDKNIKYLICGKGKLEEYLKKLADRIGISSQVIFAGYREDIHEILNIADIFVFPSIREGLGLALVEAMASGLPCVVNDNRGTRELIIDCENGVVIHETDGHEAFARAIKSLSFDKNKLAQYSAKAEATAAMFASDVVDKKMKKIYEILCRIEL